MKKLLFVVIGLAAASAMADITLDGPTFVSTTTTVSEKVTGSGYYVVTDGATLTLSNGENDFTGGVIVSNGVAQANASGAFGTGDIVLDWGTDPKAAYAQVIFNAANGTFPNNIIKKGKSYLEAYPTVCALQNATLSGDVTQTCTESGDWLYLAVGGTSDKDTVWNYDAVMTLTGTVDAGYRLGIVGWSPNYAARGKFIFKGKIKAKTFQTGRASGHLGKVELWNPENEIESINMKNFEIYAKAANVFYGAIVQGLTGPWSCCHGRASIDMGGYDQTVRYLDRSDNTAAEQDGRLYNAGCFVAFVNYTSKPVTLTVIGKSGVSNSPVTDMIIQKNIKLVIDMCDGATGISQQFTRRWSTTTAPIEINDGKMRMRDEAKFLNVSNITVGVDGTLECENTVDTFPSLTNLTVNGICRIQSKTSNVLPATSTLRIGASGRFAVYGGLTNTVNKLYVGGRYMPAGTYTKDNAAWMVDPSTWSYQYTGALVVTKGAKGLLMLVK